MLDLSFTCRHYQNSVIIILYYRKNRAGVTLKSGFDKIYMHGFIKIECGVSVASTNNNGESRSPLPNTSLAEELLARNTIQ